MPDRTGTGRLRFRLYVNGALELDGLFEAADALGAVAAATGKLAATDRWLTVVEDPDRPDIEPLYRGNDWDTGMRVAAENGRKLPDSARPRPTLPAPNRRYTPPASVSRLN